MENSTLTYYKVHLPLVDSTNKYIRENANELWQISNGATALVVSADAQSAGRGQMGNVWNSDACKNLLVSIMMRPMFLKVTTQFRLSQISALAVCATMQRYGIHAQLKWPNDVYADRKKLAGILVELDYSGQCIEQAVVGIGLNVNQTEFCTMERVPVSMKMLTGADYVVGEVLSALLDEMSQLYDMLRSGRHEYIADCYASMLMGRDEYMQYADAGGRFAARIEDVLPDGRLMLRRHNNTLSVYAFKEVEMLLNTQCL